MMAQIFLAGALCCTTLLPGLLEATSLMKIIKPEGEQAQTVSAVTIDPAKAHDFLSSRSRPKRNADKWHRNSPDFQAYYKYYNSIGHTEGLYEIDRIRMLYQQMRHLEQVHGSNAPYYQYTLGLAPTKCDPSKDKKCKTTLPPPPPPTTPAPPAPLQQTLIRYLCDPRDHTCQPHIVYMTLGSSPFPCDPRYDPACQTPQTEEPPKTEEPPPPPPPPAPKKSVPLPPPPPPPPRPYKAMEYDCDPYWDPDCLREVPHMLTKGKSHPQVPEPPPVEEEEEEEEEPAPPQPQKKVKMPLPYPYYVHGQYYNYNPYDPYTYTHHTPDSQ